MKTIKSSGTAVENGKRIVRMAILVAGLVAVSGVQAQTVAVATPAQEKSWAKRVFGRQDWTEVAKSYETPREICRLVANNVRYTTESQDNWQAADQTWTRGKGDCEDMAICVQSLCKLSGLDSKVHLYFPANGKKEGHAVLVGQWNGKTWFSSNGTYEEVSSEQDVRKRVAKMLSCKDSQLWVMKLNEGDVARYLERSPSRAVAAATTP